MITLKEMLRGFDPKGGRPVSVTRLYTANMISAEEGRRVAKKQKLDEWRARKRARDDLRRDIERIVGGEEPSWSSAKGVQNQASQLGQQAMGFPPLDGGEGGSAVGPGQEIA